MRSYYLLLILFSLGCNGPIKGLYPPHDDAFAMDVYVVNNHWHTGLVLKRSQLSPRLQRWLSPAFEESRFVEIGWGDAGFYQAPKATAPLALGAVFASRGTVLHVVGIDDDPATHFADYHVDLYRIRVTPAGHARLVNALERSFATDENDHAFELRDGLYGYSRFYRGRGAYWGLHNCNHWLAERIRDTGFPISPAYAMPADNVGWQVRVFGRRYQPAIQIQLIRDGEGEAPAEP